MFLVRHGTREFLCEAGSEVHTDLGVLELPEDVAVGDVVETHLGEAFTVRPLRGPDFLEHFERSGAPMLPRDVGLVVGHTGLQAGDRVLDAGTGTGVLACYMGRLGAAVETFEIDADAAEVARNNAAQAEVTDRVTVHAEDVREALATLVEEPDFDVITLDTEAAPTVIDRAADLLSVGGAIAVYSPFIEGARAAHEAAESVSLADVRTLETIQRPMDFDERGSRPTTSGVGHSGYLTIARR